MGRCEGYLPVVDTCMILPMYRVLEREQENRADTYTVPGSEGQAGNNGSRDRLRDGTTLHVGAVSRHRLDSLFFVFF